MIQGSSVDTDEDADGEPREDIEDDINEDTDGDVRVLRVRRQTDVQPV